MERPQEIPPNGRTSSLDGTSLGREASRATRALAVLLREHLALARIELTNEGKRVVIHSAVALGALPFFLSALVILSVALALGLGEWLGVAWGFLVVGVLELSIAGALALYGGKKLREERSRTFAHTRRELRKDRSIGRVFR